MPTLRTFARIALGGLALAEGASALARWQARRETYDRAARRAATLHRPLVVVGDPDGGAHTRLYRAYGCGDLCVDLNGCPLCKVVQVADITAGPLPGIADDSAVVFVSCVLEYVGDAAAAVHELRRIAGSPDNLFDVSVQPWTLTAALYPGARWTAVRGNEQMTLTPISRPRKALTAGALAGLAAAALWPKQG
ncbi:MAG: hypothetical protein JNK56_06655 [Myxococcales bacterium]|nr:hypothetical protein [Myxococcales bacterium]